MIVPKGKRVVVKGKTYKAGDEIKNPPKGLDKAFKDKSEEVKPKKDAKHQGAS